MPIKKELELGTYHPCETEMNAIVDCMYVEAQKHASQERFVRSLENPLIETILPMKQQVRDFIHLVCTGKTTHDGVRTLIEATMVAPKSNRFGGADQREYHMIARELFYANVSQVEPLRS